MGGNWFHSTTYDFFVKIFQSIILTLKQPVSREAENGDQPKYQLVHEFLHVDNFGSCKQYGGLEVRG